MFILANYILLNNIQAPKQDLQPPGVNRRLPVSIITLLILPAQQNWLDLKLQASMNFLMKMTAQRYPE